MMVLALIGALVGACAGAVSNQKPMLEYLCPDEVWDRYKADEIDHRTLYDNPDRYGCRWETEEERMSDWYPTNYTPWVLIGMLFGAVLGAIFVRVKRPADTAQPQSATPPTAPTPGQSYCSQCGLGNPTGARYCNGCGEITP